MTSGRSSAPDSTALPRSVREVTSRKQRPAALHVFGNVAEILASDEATRFVAVEDDEVEFLQLLLEQLAHREDDQAELAYRREIVLLRRAQVGEVDQVH